MSSRAVGILLICSVLTACAGGSVAPEAPATAKPAPSPTPAGGVGSIVLLPMGTATSPAYEGCYSFAITASEAGYFGDFTISVSGTGFTVQQQTTDSGSWVASPALLCVSGSESRFVVTDTLGHSASTYASTL